MGRVDRDGARVLVVDDDGDIRMLIGHVLGSAGMVVDEAAGGTQALTTLGALHDAGSLPHAVILDVQMPVVDGWDVLAAVRADERLADIAVVMCTVKSSARDAVRAWDLGCDGYVTKPFDNDSLVEELTGVLLLDAPGRRARRRERLVAECDRLAAERRA